MISGADLDETVRRCDLERFRAYVEDVLHSASTVPECDSIRAMKTFNARPSRENLRSLLIEVWPFFTMARHFMKS